MLAKECQYLHERSCAGSQGRRLVTFLSPANTYPPKLQKRASVAVLVFGTASHGRKPQRLPVARR